MPIEYPLTFERLSQQAFQKLDFDIMNLAFEAHRILGRNCDEEIYHNHLAARIEAAGLGKTLVEVMIHVRHGSFHKEYRMDLVVGARVVYELKATRDIATQHEGQTLNYLLLVDCEHGKVINFGGTSVGHRFVNNPVNREERYRYSVRATPSWRGPDVLRISTVEFIEDIGLFLEAPLYNQVLVHHFGGPDHAIERRSMSLGGIPLGQQAFQMCGPDEAFRITTLSRNLSAQRQSLERLLQLSDLKALHWINLNRHQVEFTTLTRS
jgi:iron complex transport system substrate-binding protein